MAETPKTPMAILALAKKMQGGRAWDGVRSLRKTGTLKAGGMEGTLETLEDLGGGSRLERYDLGVVKGAEGLDGSVSWEQDPSGQIVVKGDPEAVEVANTERYLATRAYWFPDRWPAELETGKVVTENGRNFQILRILPKGGRVFEIWVDLESFLFDRIQEGKDGKTETTYFSDYRETNGLRLPFHLKTGRGTPDSDSLVQYGTVWVNPALESKAFAPPAPPVRDSGFDARMTFSTLPIHLGPKGHVYVQAQLDVRAPLWFCLDSGSEMFLLAPSVAKALEAKQEGALPISGVGAGSHTVSIVKISKIQLGDAWIDNPRFAVLSDVERMGTINGAPCAGVLGFDLFKRFVVRIDYAAKRLTLIRPEGWKQPATGYSVPFVFRGKRPFVEGELDGVKGGFVVDTGSDSTLDVFAPFVAKHRLTETMGVTYPQIGDGGIGGEIQGRRARAKELKLGEARIMAPLVNLSTMAQGGMAQETGIGNVGVGFLKHFTVTFDYRQQILHFEPNAAWGVPDRWSNTHGLILEMGSGTIDISDVLTPSPASLAGIKAGDQILALDGKSGPELTPGFLIHHLFEAAEGTRVQLKVNSGGVERQVELTLKALL